MSDDQLPIELKELFAKRPQVIKPGLERIQKALPFLDGVEKVAPMILVAGTNGKGTTAGYLWQMLSVAGYKAGLFTSPHLEHFSERFSVTGETFDDQSLIKVLGELREKVPPTIYDEMSFFEVNTLLALMLFREHETEVNILEVGMGGRWDSTNVVDPSLSVITSIGLDHTEFLGDSLEKIAEEKAGIMRSGCSCLWAGEAHTEADRAIRRLAVEKTAWLYVYDEDFGLGSGRKFFIKKSQQTRKFELPPYFFDLPQYLRRNFVTALAAYYHIVNERILPERAAAVAKPAAVAESVLLGAAPLPTSLRGRFQELNLRKPIGTIRQLILDACHNPDGARTFAATLEERYNTGRLPKPLPACVSILKDKNHGEILDAIRTVCSPVILFANHSERSWSAGDVVSRHRDLLFVDSFEEALAFMEPRAERKPVVICGSVHLMGEVLTSLTSEDS